MPLDGVAGYKFIIQTADYAANFATYQIRETVGDPEPLPTRLAFDENLRTWSTFHKEGLLLEQQQMVRQRYRTRFSYRCG